jgi:hypothetical protein
MARIRSIMPEYWQDEKLSPLPPIDRLVFLGLISQADDAGRLVDNPRLLDGLLFPHTKESCAPSLEVLAELGRILRYTSDSGQRLIQIVGWERHQKVKNPSAYNLPAPPATGSGETRGRLGGEPNAPTVCRISPIPDPLTDADANASGAAVAAPPVDNSPKEPTAPSVSEWLGYFMPILRECGFEADDTDGSILKHWHKRKFSADDVEAAIRGTALFRTQGKLKAFEGAKLSLRLLYARPKPDKPVELRPLWNEAQEEYHRTLGKTKARDPNAGNQIGSILERMAR